MESNVLADGAVVGLSLPKTRFEHSDGVVRQGLDARQCLRTARRAVCRAHPSRAKRGSEPHCNRSRISQGFAEGAQRLTPAIWPSTRTGSIQPNGYPISLV